MSDTCAADFKPLLAELRYILENYGVSDMEFRTKLHANGISPSMQERWQNGENLPQTLHEKEALAKTLDFFAPRIRYDYYPDMVNDLLEAAGYERSQSQRATALA